MTAIKIVTVPISLLVIAIIAMISMPALALLNVGSATLPDEPSDVFLIPVTGDSDDNVRITYSELHSDSDHDPFKAGSTAEKIVTKLVTGWPGKPDGKNWLCFTIKIGEVVARTVYWEKTGNGVGNLSWYNHQSQTWGGAYPDKFQAAAGNLPGNLKSVKGATIRGGCDGNNPPPFTPATN